MLNHGINATEQVTSISTPVVAESGVPFVVGIAPVQAATNPTKPGIPVLCTEWNEAVAKLGYSDDWEKYTLGEFMYSHLKAFACQPVIFLNVLDITKHKEAVAASDKAVSDKKILLPIDAIADENLIVKAAGDAGDVLELGKDYEAYYEGENLVIELLEDGTVYAAENLSVAYNQVNPKAITETDIVNGFEAVELCLSRVGICPDLLLAPFWSHNSTVASVMASKAANINGILKAKAICDVDCSEKGAKSYDNVLAVKNDNNMTDSEQILCWPMVKLGDKKFHLSTQLAGLMATVDAENEGCPYESPSNKNLKIDGLCLADGSEVDLTLLQANVLNKNGIVTAMNFFNGWVAWGNYNACYPTNTDVKDYFIPVSRMFKWVGNTLVKTFWTKVDDPTNRRLVGTVIDSANIWINGLVGRGYLLGGRFEMLDSENPQTDLMAGIVRIHCYLTPPSPAQQIDFILEYDVNYIKDALS